MMFFLFIYNLEDRSHTFKSTVFPPLKINVLAATMQKMIGIRNVITRWARCLISNPLAIKPTNIWLFLKNAKMGQKINVP